MHTNVPTGAALVVDYDVAMEVASHEAIIRQAYKDSEGVWIWSVGLTSATGHVVERYIGNRNLSSIAFASMSGRWTTMLMLSARPSQASNCRKSSLPQLCLSTGIPGRSARHRRSSYSRTASLRKPRRLS